MFKGKSLLITGGTGSFGKAFVTKVLKNYNIKRLVVFISSPISVPNL